MLSEPSLLGAASRRNIPLGGNRAKLEDEIKAPNEPTRCGSVSALRLCTSPSSLALFPPEIEPNSQCIHVNSSYILTEHCSNYLCRLMLLAKHSEVPLMVTGKHVKDFLIDSLPFFKGRVSAQSH